MEGVADQHRQHAAVVDFAVVRVTVPPQHQLLEDEEQEDADEQRGEDVLRRQLLERLGQDRQHRRAEQCADRVADQPRDQPRPRRIVDEEDAGSDDKTTEAAQDAQPERDQEN